MSRTLDPWLRWRVAGSYISGLVSLWLAHPTRNSLLLGALITALGLVIRGAAAGYLRKGQALARTGPYARTRNPLYLGSAFLWGGFAVATRSWIVAAIFLAYFLAFYPAVMKREEASLRGQYGEVFDEYARQVPQLRPRLRLGTADGGPPFSIAQYLRNREYQAVIVAVVFFGFLCALARWRT